MEGMLGFCTVHDIDTRSLTLLCFFLVNQNYSLISSFPVSCYQAPGVSGLDLAFGAQGDGVKVHRASVVGDKEQFYSLLGIYRLWIKGKK